jgi:hypothetical protein
MKDAAANSQLTPSADSSAQIAARCGNCQFFCDLPAQLDAQFPQLRTLGSVYGSVRGMDGLCERHQRYLSPGSCCNAHEPRSHMQPASQVA